MGCLGSSRFVEILTGVHYLHHEEIGMTHQTQARLRFLFILTVCLLAGRLVVRLVMPPAAQLSYLPPGKTSSEPFPQPSTQPFPQPSPQLPTPPTSARPSSDSSASEPSPRSNSAMAVTQSPTAATHTGTANASTSATVLQLPAVKLDEIINEVARLEDAGRYRFAKANSVELTPKNSGEWQVAGNDRLSWSLAVHAEDARSLNFGFSSFHLPNSAELKLKDSSGRQIWRSFTSADNAAHGQLWTPVMEDDTVFLEVEVAASEQDEVMLELASVNQGFRDWKSYEALKIGNRASGECHIDVACDAIDLPSGLGARVDLWRDQIQAVGAYTLLGVDTCTGQLVNNTLGANIPYFLTAAHCEVSNANAPSMVVYWGFENSNCRPVDTSINGLPGDGPLTTFNSGATLRALNPVADMCLVELDDPVPTSANAYFAGWDNSGALVTEAACIHHPSISEKRISFANDPLELSDFLSTVSNPAGVYLRVSSWDHGATEGGSSGSGLFDQNRRLVGMLTGGFAACGNGLSDWYGSLSASWTGNNPASRLSDWLDPIGTGATTLDGRFLDETLRVLNTSVLEGDSGSLPTSIEITLTPASADPVSVEVVLSNNTALAGTDYIAMAPFTVNFPAGSTSETFSVSIIGDTLPEEHEKVEVFLQNPVNAGVVQSSGIITILNNDYLVPVITSTNFGTATAGFPFSFQVTASNTPTSYTLAGSVPAGMTMDSASGLITWTPTNAGSFSVTTEASNPAGTDSLSLTIAVAPNSLVDALELPSGVTFTGGSDWFSQAVVTHDGIDAAQSGPIGNDDTSVMTLNLSGPDRLLFWWKVDTMDGFNNLQVRLDGNQQDSITGSTQWEQSAVVIPPGPHTIEFVYQVINTGNHPVNAGWVDELVLESDISSPYIFSPQEVVGTIGSPFFFQVEALGMPTNFTAAGLPPGLGMTASGLISGTPTALGAFTPTVTATSAAGSGTQVLNLQVRPLVSEAVDAPALTFTPSGRPWFTQFDITHDGVDAAQSASSANSTMLTTITGPETLVFWWKVSSEEGFDLLDLILDGAIIETISGEVDWTPVVVTIPAGSHTVAWRYSKDPSVSVGLDAGWVDEVTLISYSTQPVFYSEDRLDLTQGEAVQFQVEASLFPSFTATGLPAGMSLNNSGMLAGTPIVPGTYSVEITATDAIGMTATQTLTIEVGPSLNDAADQYGITWIEDTNQPWFGQYDVSYDGQDALQAGATPNSSSSELLAVIEGPDLLSFWWQVSSEEFYDLLTVELDGMTVTTISGLTSWEEMMIEIPTGVHTVRWVYAKDINNVVNQDTAWIDQVQLASHSSGINGTVWQDFNRNALVDENLAMLGSSNAVLALFEVVNGATNELAYINADTNGGFAVSNLPAGSYEIELLIASLPEQGSDFNPTTPPRQRVDLTANTTISTLFGWNLTPTAIELLSFERHTNGGIDRLVWRAVDGGDSLGFRISAQDQRTGESWVSDIIWAEQKEYYEWTGPSSPDLSYYLEWIGTDLQQELFGPAIQLLSP